jgi:bifunctional non-homologous end joining protein LigD
MRVLADVRDGRLTLTSRAGNDATASFPELAGLADLYDDMLLDGEVVALDGGRPSFGALAERMHVRDRRKAERLATTRPVTFMVFDLLRLYGSDLTSQPLSARRELLERLDLDGRHWQVPPVYDDGQELFDATLEQGLEGVVSKRRSSPYLPGRRSADWLKSPHRATHSVVVGGWRPEQTNDSGRLGAVLVGTPDGEGGWAFLGRVGSGIAGRAATLLAEEIGTATIPSSPFSTPVPRVDAVGTTWVEPRVVVEVRALEVTRDGRLRQPAYLGVRPDLTPADLQEVNGA